MKIITEEQHKMKKLNPNIYLTTNLINGKIYVGQSRYDNPKYLGSGRLFTKAKKKYGVANFQKEILEYCDLEFMNEKEIYWILFYDSKNNGYNLHMGGSYKYRDDEFKKNLSKSLKGREVSQETRDKISKSLMGVSHTQERKDETSIRSKKRIGHLHNNWGKKLNRKVPVSQKTKTQIAETLKKFYSDNPSFKDKIKETNSHSVVITNLLSQEKIQFQSMKSASCFLKCSRPTIRNRNKKEYKGYSINIIE